jgi:hypothetical protein
MKNVKTKRTIYILLAMFLGILLSFVIHAIVEIFYIKFAIAGGRHITGYFVFGTLYCALPPAFTYISTLAGIIGGYFLGKK